MYLTGGFDLIFFRVFHLFSGTFSYVYIMQPNLLTPNTTYYKEQQNTGNLHYGRNQHKYVHLEFILFFFDYIRELQLLFSTQVFLTTYQKIPLYKYVNSEEFFSRTLLNLGINKIIKPHICI